MRSPWTLSKGNGLFSFFSSPSPWCWQWVWDGHLQPLSHTRIPFIRSKTVMKGRRHVGSWMMSETMNGCVPNVPVVVLTAWCQCHHTLSTCRCMLNRALSRQMLSNTTSVFCKSCRTWNRMVNITPLDLILGAFCVTSMPRCQNVESACLDASVCDLWCFRGDDVDLCIFEQR